MADDKNNLLLFFDRPSEPIFMQKGQEKASFQLPDHYFPDQYKDLAPALSERFGENNGKIIPIRNISIPDLSLPLELGRQEQFSLFVRKHRRMAAKLIDIFLGMRNIEDLTSICAYCQPRMNPYLMNYALSVALLHRPDTKGLNIPTFVESFPDKFMDPKVFKRARETTTAMRDADQVGSRDPITIPANYTANSTEPEQAVAYFREDLGINLHHWHWHLVYPFDSANREVVNKDRRGELFFYMHQQIIARYDFERLSNGLPRVRPYTNFREPIVEAYFPKMDSIVASRAWPPRFSNTRISDLKRSVDQIDIDVTTLETWRDRFLDAVNRGRIILPNNREMPLDENTGIDTLGNLMEASIISRNPGYYGDLHNMGHVFVSYAHDPDHRYLEQFGVMGDSATAMRDPIFYRWHKYVDDIFQIHKRSLPVYNTDRLDFPGVQVSGISVQTTGGQANTFNTMWQQSTVDLSRGMDFVPRGTVNARFTHLQHVPFEYVIECNNTTGAATSGTVRIFVAPRNDANGQPFRNFDEQRIMMVELDKFTQNLRPGRNMIRRRSSESSVTIPFERTFRNLDQNRPAEGTAEAAAFDFCGCGWPQHMLIPRGNQAGTPVELFCMISNGANDRVEQNVAGQCNDAESYCGIRDARYPDQRSMGYPFDRRGRDGVTSLQNFLTPNMKVTQYDFERLSNGLPRVRPYTNFREPIVEAYFPKMDSIVASRAWPPRFSNTRISDLKRSVDQIDIDVTTLETWRDRFLDAVNRGRIILPNNREMPLDENTGIDTLGNLMEASIISRNPGYYGDLHNMGHVFVSYAHDPDHRYLEQFGVMGDSATAMRDPIFYRWHKYVDDIFQIHKRSLPVYNTDRLDFPGVQVSGISVQTTGGQANTFNTMWQQSTVDLSRGMDFVPRGTVNARFTHLQHVPFEYVIECNNTTGAATSGTVRIFVAPRNDANGQPFRNFDEQRIMMVELDKFTQNLRPGRNMIRRRSSESSVTIPFERTFRNLDQNRPAEGTAEAAAFDFCGCGWPQHMLIPRGNQAGTPVELFCMISNGANDRVEQNVAGQCNDAESYCGIRDARYPDQRSMGYPFDRRGRDGVTSLQNFLTPNMKVTQCVIRFTDQTSTRT